jgi:hypothetical protein
VAQTQQQLHDRLLELAPPVADELRAAWQASAEAAAPDACAGLDRWLILIACRDETQQTEMLGRRLHGEGVECKALLSQTTVPEKYAGPLFLLGYCRRAARCLASLGRSRPGDREHDRPGRLRRSRAADDPDHLPG